jgi:dTDP-4-dehydrorhamnose 3,5-epimerase
MKFIKTSISDVYLIDPAKKTDNRGWFSRLWDQPVVNVDLSVNTKKGTLRGMHWQARPDGEIKVVTCIKGEIFDVVLDLRPSSKSYQQWLGVKLNALSHRLIYIPKGCAHGFITLTDNTEVMYFMAQPHRPESGRGLRYDDPALAIKWPIPVKVISTKDKNWPNFKESDDHY